MNILVLGTGAVGRDAYPFAKHPLGLPVGEGGVRSTQTAHPLAVDLSNKHTLLSKKKNPRSQGNEGQ